MTKIAQTKLITPHASVVIYNYRDRFGTKSINANPQEIDEVILHTASLLSIRTSKSKSSPSGSFEIHLAPTKNWITAITPGSWCVILMSREAIDGSDVKYNSPKVDAKKFKMLGRIDSVRVTSVKNNESTALETRYIVTGRDWGCIFEAKLYLDLLTRSPESNPIGTAESLFYDELVKQYADGRAYDSSVSTSQLLAFWGRTDASSAAIGEATKGQNLAKAINQFAIPNELAKYMKFVDDNSTQSAKIAQTLKTVYGKLVTLDRDNVSSDIAYKDISDGIGFINPSTVFGTNMIWQLLSDNANLAINELFTEIRFENEYPKLTLYKRIKPFLVNGSSALTKDATKVGDGSSAVKQDQCLAYKSDFKNVKRAIIPIDEVLSINAGTNWRDKFNFIEVNVDVNTKSKAFVGMSTDIKTQSQFFDHNSIARDGFQPLKMVFKYIPVDPKTNTPDALNVVPFKYLGKEWYFDIHRMLNGTITIIGQDNYIGVGDNIMIDANILSSANNSNKDNIRLPKKSFLLAHVENVSHAFSVSPNGSRNFISEIQFVRGIITDSNGNKLIDDPMLTQDSALITPSDEVNSDRVFGTSSGGKNGKSDPDIQKLRGR